MIRPLPSPRAVRLPSYWVSQLAEELAEAANSRDAALVSRRIREEAKRHQLAEWTVTKLVACEWDRLGIVRLPPDHEARVL